VPGSTPAFLPRLGGSQSSSELGRFFLADGICTSHCDSVQKRGLARECTTRLGKKLPVFGEPFPLRAHRDRAQWPSLSGQRAAHIQQPAVKNASVLPGTSCGGFLLSSRFHCVEFDR
jgi:hypothetical protein